MSITTVPSLHLLSQQQVVGLQIAPSLENSTLASSVQKINKKPLLEKFRNAQIAARKEGKELTVWYQRYEWEEKKQGILNSREQHGFKVIFKGPNGVQVNKYVDVNFLSLSSEEPPAKLFTAASPYLQKKRSQNLARETPSGVRDLTASSTTAIQKPLTNPKSSSSSSSGAEPLKNFVLIQILQAPATVSLTAPAETPLSNPTNSSSSSSESQPFRNVVLFQILPVLATASLTAPVENLLPNPENRSSSSSEAEPLRSPLELNASSSHLAVDTHRKELVREVIKKQKILEEQDKEIFRNLLRFKPPVRVVIQKPLASENLSN